jgi:two-component system nitrogen regulation response regulator NtrX
VPPFDAGDAMPKTVLVADDEKGIRETLKRLLEYEHYRVLLAEDGLEALKMVESELLDIVLLDIKMPGMDGLEVLARLHQSHPQLPVVIISGHGTIQTAVESTKLGAFDFIEKPIDADRMLLVIRNGLAQAGLLKENISLKQKYEKQTRIVGEHPSMAAILDTLSKVAPTNTRVLIMGENGTGKELVARRIHEMSGRAREAYIEVNCAAIPEELIESELFGHEKGAFTGATSRRIGKFELANGGTIFLDEVGDMSLSAQAKVLRVLQESQFERVGGSETKRVDVRVLAASNKDLMKESQEERFRQDLFYRLNVVPINVPPLRKRITDVPLLCAFFLEQTAEELGQKPKKLSKRALDALMDYSWPGNVRELKNLIERLVILTRNPLIDVADLPPLGPVKKIEERYFDKETYSTFREAIEKDFFLEKLKENNFNVSKTARKLDMQRSNLYKKLEKYDIPYKRRGDEDSEEEESE